jgi:hypothetical protein
VRGQADGSAASSLATAHGSSRFSETMLNSSVLPKASRGMDLRPARACRQARVNAASAACEPSTSISIRFIAISTVMPAWIDR